MIEMRSNKLQVLTLLGALLLVAAGRAANPNPPAVAAAAPGAGQTIFLPLIVGPGVCPATSGNAYAAGPVRQWDSDNPVRPAWNHADKNLALRGYLSNPGAFKGFMNYGSNDPIEPPQLATLFSPNRVPAFTGAYQVYNWNWAPSPDPGTRGSLDIRWDITVLGMGVTPGEGLTVPSSGYDIGGGMQVIVLFADAQSVTFKYTRDDSVAPNGYTLHVDNICTDPNLLALYQSLDGGARYVYYGTPGSNYEYDLPNLPAGQVFGTARDGEIRVAIVDTGSFMDPRSCNDWWQIRPGRSCP